jgi:hypothetical protein
MNSNGRGRLLIGKQDIMKYLSIGAPAFYDFVKMGMPARVIQNRWYAHSENIDTFFKQITARSSKDIPEDAE